MLKVDNFRIALLAGTFFRLGQGATPFLFPLMLQLAFGLSPFESGMVTFAGAVGALIAKFAANWIFAHWGFKYPLMISTAISAAGILAMGFYAPDTPIPLILVILVFTGFWQSTFWTGSNAFTFADIDDKDAGQANVMSQVWGQLMFAMGVALGGGLLELAIACAAALNWRCRIFTPHSSSLSALPRWRHCSCCACQKMRAAN